MAVNKASSPSIGLVTTIDTVQRNPLGFTVQGDAGDEYIYLSGVASTVAGDWVFYDELGATTRAVTSSVFGPVAVAMAAIVASNWGWYCIKSLNVTGNIVSDTFLDDHQAYISGTAGSLDDDSGTGQTVYGVISRAVGSGTTLAFQILYPFVLGTAPA
jgi:hypothetical protein